MTEQGQSTPGWMWIVGAIVIVALILLVLRIIDLIFSLPVLVIVILAVGGYLWYRNNQQSKV